MCACWIRVTKFVEPVTVPREFPPGFTSVPRPRLSQTTTISRYFDGDYDLPTSGPVCLLQFSIRPLFSLVIAVVFRFFVVSISGIFYLIDIANCGEPRTMSQC
ncbi:hypothetical protein GWI33_023318 [Rhynchophorus ferrugineus]|uniref:Uncharacterized protein n=1 Tax=Rhynchophorus ferrugineus TaxID=354439 RepID=A0A834HLH6_RHYFE|nr:hypothetical protein GWI33_023318 [Rhynchophorus ferrugineus]